jgi:hypothetical protein
MTDAAHIEAHEKDVHMTELLQRAFDEISKLSAQEQDAVAAWILEELASEDRWQRLFARSGDVLSRLAAEARAEYHAGRTRPLDPDKL